MAGACVGGGGSVQTVPDVVHPGDTARLQLRLSVTGGRIAGRYDDVALYYRLVGAADYERAQEPRPLAVDERHVTYEFTIPPYPAGTRGPIEYYFTAALDGHPARIPAMKQIRIE